MKYAIVGILVFTMWSTYKNSLVDQGRSQVVQEVQEQNRKVGDKIRDGVDKEIKSLPRDDADLIKWLHERNSSKPRPKPDSL